jgi:anti-sigma factor RsiW
MKSRLKETDVMDHDEAIRQKATERYLLDELQETERDEFEEHLFDCQDCALDVRAAAAFVEQSKVILAEEAVFIPAPVRVQPEKRQRFAWLRPAFVVPVFALLLVVIGYQEFKYKNLQEAANTPQVLPFAVINVIARGSAAAEVQAQPGGNFELQVNIPPSRDYVSYKLDLYGSQGQLEWSRTIPAASADDTRLLYVPRSSREAGNLGLAVHGVTSAGGSVDLGRYPIAFQSQQ